MPSSLHRTLCMLVVAGAFAGGCQNKVGQCNELVGAIQKHTTGVRDAVDRLADVERDPSVAEAFGKLTKEAHTDIGKLEFSDARLAELRGDYLALLDRAEAWSRELAEAARTGDVQTLGEVKRDAVAVAEREVAIVDAVNEYCQG